MKIRSIVILTALVILLSSCSNAGVNVHITGDGPPAQTTAANTEQATPEPTIDTDQPTPVPTVNDPTPEPSPTVKPPDINNDYMIIVDKEDNAFGIFECGEDGEPGLLVDTFPCALGRSSRMTPTGTYKTGDKGRWKEWNAWKNPQYSPYYTYYAWQSGNYNGGLYIHGPEYTAKSGDKMVVKSYNQIGTNCTSGCIRTTTEGAYWVYTYCRKGTIIEIVKSSDLVSWPGLPEIDPEYPKWDPTDPDLPH